MLFITGLEVQRLNEPCVCQYHLLPLYQVHAMDMLLSASCIDSVCIATPLGMRETQPWEGGCIQFAILR